MSGPQHNQHQTPAVYARRGVSNQRDPYESHWEAMRQLLQGMNRATWRRLPDTTEVRAVEPSVIYQLDTGVYAHAIQYPEQANAPAALHIWADLRDHSEEAPIPNIYLTASYRLAKYQPILEDGLPNEVLRTLFMYLTDATFFFNTPLPTRMEAWKAGQWPPTAADLRQCAWLEIALDNFRQLQPSPVEWRLSMGELDATLVEAALRAWGRGESGPPPLLAPANVVSSRLVTPAPTPAPTPVPSAAPMRMPTDPPPPPPTPPSGTALEWTVVQWLFEEQRARWKDAQAEVFNAGQSLISAVTARDESFKTVLTLSRTDTEKVLHAQRWLTDHLSGYDPTERDHLFGLRDARVRAEGAETEAKTLTEQLCGRLPGGHHRTTETGRPRCERCGAELAGTLDLALATPGSDGQNNPDWLR